ncbi:hypothetical protein CAUPRSCDRAFT_12449 [Caulochytrium protostelioides]|uniref:Uncharacterized protein n=1 Tax=Caulochytrium protostelioides TaxID=1555241 RepID=A0A4P9WUB9_9FUNG|nr:hypothetical protein CAUPRSCDRAFT_12449 [Caulochytrium protostelioides]
MKGQPGHEMPIHYQYFSEYRFWLKRLSDITRARELELVRFKFHYDLVTLELLWLYFAVSLRYHSSDPRPVNLKGEQVEWTEFQEGSQTTKLSKMQRCFELVMKNEKVIRDLLHRVYGDIPAADQSNPDLTKDLLEKVLMHLSSKVSMLHLRRHDEETAVRASDLSIFNQAREWISDVPDLKYIPFGIDGENQRSTAVSFDNDKLQTMMKTLQSLLGPMIGPKVHEHDAVNDLEVPGKSKTPKAFARGPQTAWNSLFAHSDRRLYEVLTFISEYMTESIQSTMSSEKLWPYFESSVTGFDQRVALLKKLSPDVEVKLPLSKFNWKLAALIGPEDFFQAFDPPISTDASNVYSFAFGAPETPAVEGTGSTPRARQEHPAGPPTLHGDPDADNWLETYIDWPKSVPGTPNDLESSGAHLEHTTGLSEAGFRNVMRNL